MAGREPSPPCYRSAGVVVMSRASHERDPIGEYLDQLRAGLRTGLQEAELILAEAEDHLRETAAAGLATGMTEREAQEAAISSFGPVRAVVRAHHARRGWLAAAGQGGLAAWKLASILLLTSGVTGLAIAAILTIWPPVVVQPGGVPTQAPVPIFLGVSDSLWLAWAAAAAGGAILLAGCAVTLRRRRRRGRGMLLGGFFPMVAAGFFGAIALALTALNASDVRVPGPVPVPGRAAVAFLALAVGYAIRMARTLRRQSRGQAGASGRVLGKG
jgi:hypothetical protein